MSDRTKLILKILGFIAIVLIMAWIIWALFFKAPSQSYIPGRTTQTQEQGQLPQTQEGPGGQVIDTTQRPSTLVPEETPQAPGPDIVASGSRTLAKQITPTRADFSAMTSSGNFNYYDWRDEKFYRVTPGSNPSLLSDEIFRSVESAAWSHNGDTAILEFPDKSNIYYNFETGQQATLPREAQEFTFSPDDNQLAYEYIGASEDDRWIITSSPDGQGQQLIQPLGKESRNVKVDWSPNNQVIATYRNPTSSFGEEVFFIGFNEENNLSLQTNGIGFEGAWSPKGKQILYSVYNESTNYNPVLYISGAEGDNIGLGNRSLQVQTWPDKCSFASEDTVYCAVPQYLDQGSGIFREQTQTVPDTIYKIDLINNQSTPIAFPETENQSSFTIENIMISDDGSELYFTDRVSGRINSIRLR
ncbi:MAG: hypothetical protein CO042_03505 [Parcubacteria group bacterium CG_4_9_14_0_2_um_filter_41_8]|nr:MAG: hypothetical protein COV79_00885 [Parcubacteria group bacterium CG11_big_fil_rev_8_21_14_0_20_41_14]PIR56607.1 MAG: hypothetical protein COU72_05355 [Parcubacteria group bacterium CG10_big_fil_rev_8_21_14_0_10_41_35]PJC40492.1 MAG: hypothetical protein CO042_03505 [Parcubacteria group bacterium CG_4_9_14_0_2_um_filter_41_8]